MQSHDPPYDVVIVGAGISGAVLARELSRAGKRVLVLEAGTGQPFTWNGYQENLRSFYTASAKTPESPWPFNPDAPQPDVTDVDKPATSYFVQRGAQPFRSTYARMGGGTTLHWLGTCLRMLPEDFGTRTRYGVGLDWPMTYEELAPFYDMAEFEIGVSADVEEQAYLGITFPPGYVYPMHRIPPSWLDRTVARAVDGQRVRLGREEVEIRVRSTPQGRNSIPNPGYRPPEALRGDGVREHGYTPVGAVDPRREGQDVAHDLGQRCAGNNSCTPICPIQAKYNANKTLSRAVKTGHVKVTTQAVASRVMVDEGGRVTGIQYKRYGNPASPEHTVEVARGTVYVLAAHAVENAKLMLASELEGSSGQMGRNLMDHPVMINWGLMPERVGAFRGPLCTSGIEDLRGGAFRSEHAAFRMEIGNEGWVWPMGAPDTTVDDAVKRRLFGARLREHLGEVVSRQFRVGFLIEQLPGAHNRVTIDRAYTDPLGNYRPVIHYDLDAYTLEGMKAARRVSDLVFERTGAADLTQTEDNYIGSATWQGVTYPWDGAGHFAGTHLMGRTPRDSVVDADQRSWEHRNLFLVGCGSMPTMGTSNPTLTITALAFRTARALLRDLDAPAPAVAATPHAPLAHRP